MAIVIEEASSFEVILNYALFAGAIFQLICIFAVMVVPQSEAEKAYETTTNVAASEVQTPGTASRSSHDHSSRRGRRDRKKHR